MSTKQTREQKIEAAAADRGWLVERVGQRRRLVVADTGTVVADDWATGGGLTLDEIEAALAL